MEHVDYERAWLGLERAWLGLAWSLAWSLAWPEGERGDKAKAKITQSDGENTADLGAPWRDWRAAEAR